MRCIKCLYTHLFSFVNYTFFTKNNHKCKHSVDAKCSLESFCQIPLLKNNFFFSVQIHEKFQYKKYSSKSNQFVLAPSILPRILRSARQDFKALISSKWSTFLVKLKYLTSDQNKSRGQLFKNEDPLAFVGSSKDYSDSSFLQRWSKWSCVFGEKLFRSSSARSVKFWKM